MKESAVRVGIIGLGDHSNRSHLAYLADMTDLCQITAIADIDENRITAANTEFNLTAQGYDNSDELLASDNVDAVFIMTPDRFHTAQTVGAVINDKHVFCEKPLASDREEYDAIKTALDEAEAKDIIVSTCHPRRFDPPFLKTKEYIDNRDALLKDFGASGELGKVIGFGFNFDYHEPSKQGLHHSLMFDHLNHEIDAMHFLFGFSEVRDLVKHYDGETEFKVTGSRTDNIDFIFTGARHRKEKIYPEDMVIQFENGSLAADLHAGIATLELAGQTYTRQDDTFKTNYSERFISINRHFLRSVLGLEPPYISAVEMLTNTRAAIDLHEQPAVSKYIR